jgi:hypothetical protein
MGEVPGVRATGHPYIEDEDQKLATADLIAQRQGPNAGRDGQP